MSQARIVAVFGATGTQGSSVVNALLADGTFIPRAITRDDTSEESQKMKAAGAQVAKADMGDVQSLNKAIAGSEAVYMVTVPFNPALTENTQASLILDASKAAGVNYLICSTLPSIKEATGGKLTNVKHFDDKAVIDKLVDNSGIPHTKVYLGYFLENMWKYGALKSNDSGGLDFGIVRSTADTKQMFVWAGKEVGLTALALLKKYTEAPAEVIDKSFVIASTRMTYGELVEALNKGLGKKVNFITIQSTGIPDMDESFEFLTTYGWFNDTVIPEPKLVSWGALPESGTVEEFIAANKARLLSC